MGINNLSKMALLHSWSGEIRHKLDIIQMYLNGYCTLLTLNPSLLAVMAWQPILMFQVSPLEKSS